MELALEWEETQRAVMYNPSKADYFLQYTDGMGHKNGTIYNGESSEASPFPQGRSVPASTKLEPKFDIHKIYFGLLAEPIEFGDQFFWWQIPNAHPSPSSSSTLSHPRNTLEFIRRGLLLP